MTNKRYNDLSAVDPESMSEDEVKEGWHYCWEFDGLLVGPGMGELNWCTCLPSDHPARKTVPPEEMTYLDSISPFDT